jgi:hypothetical protein
MNDTCASIYACARTRITHAGLNSSNACALGGPCPKAPHCARACAPGMLADKAKEGAQLDRGRQRAWARHKRMHANDR